MGMIQKSVFRGHGALLMALILPISLWSGFQLCLLLTFHFPIIFHVSFPKVKSLCLDEIGTL